VKVVFCSSIKREILLYNVVCTIQLLLTAMNIEMFTPIFIYLLLTLARAAAMGGTIGR
jgi:hypothetical protein